MGAEGGARRLGDAKKGKGKGSRSVWRREGKTICMGEIRGQYRIKG